LSQTQRNKLRELLWMVDKTPAGQMDIPLPTGIVTVIKSAGCSLMSGVAFVSGTEKFALTHMSYWTSKRTVIISKDSKFDKLSPVLKWLDLKSSQFDYNDDVGIGWLKVIRGQNISTYRQYAERMHTIGIWFLNMLSCNSGSNCKEYSDRNSVKYNRYLKEAGEPLIKYHQSAVNHKFLIHKVESRRMWKWFKKEVRYELIDEHWVTASVDLTSTDEEWMHFYRECVLDMTTSDLIKGTTGYDIEIPGLYLPLSKHYQIGTEIKQLVGQQINKLVMLCQPGMHDSIRIATTKDQIYKQEIRKLYPNLTINTGNYDIIQGGVVGILEQIMINCLGKTNKDSNELVVYGGPNPAAITIQGKYYIKIDKPDQDEDLMMYHDQESLVVNSMITRYNAGRDKDNWANCSYNGQHCLRYLLGVGLLHVTEKQLRKRLDRTDNLYGWCPKLITEGTWFRYNKDNNYIMYRGDTFTRRVQNKLQLHILHGKPLFVNRETNSFYESSVIQDAFDMVLVRLRRRQIPESKMIKCVITDYKEHYDLTRIEVPWIETNLIDIIKKRSFITLRSLTISRSLLRTLLLRLITGDDSEESLLAYARTVQSTQVITEKGISDLQNVDLHTTMTTTWFALYIHNDYINKFMYLIKLIKLGEEKSMLLSLIQQFVPGLMHLLGQVSEGVTNTIEYWMNEHTIDVYYLTNVEKALTRVRRTNWTKYNPIRKLLCHQFNGDDNEQLRQLTEHDDSNDQDEDKANSELSHTGLESRDSDDESFMSADVSFESDSVMEGKSNVEAQVVSSPSVQIEESKMTQDEGPTIAEMLITAEQENQEDNKVTGELVEELPNLEPDYMDLIDIPWDNYGEKTQDWSYMHSIHYYPELRPERGRPPKVVEYKGKNHIIPKILWFYWEGEKIHELIVQCIRSWAYHNEEYRIIFLTEKNLKHYTGAFKIGDLKKLMPAHKSDILRTWLLANYGGIWVNASTVCTGNIDYLVEATADHKTGVFQISDTKNRYGRKYEVGFIICSMENEFMSKWNELMTECYEVAGGDSREILHHLEVKYSEYYNIAVQVITETPKYYLNCYLIEQVVIQMLEQEPLSINEQDCEEDEHVMVFNGKNHIPLEEISLKLAKITPQDWKCVCPILFLISHYRHEMISKYGDDGDKGSILYLLKRYQPINYNIQDVSGLKVSIKQKQREKRQAPLIKMRDLEYLLISFGTIGDVIPIKQLSDIIGSYGAKYAVITHREFFGLFGDCEVFDIGVSSKDTIKLAMELKDRNIFELGLAAAKHANTICNATDQVLKLHEDLPIHMICTHSFIPVRTFKSYYGSDWTVINTFPIEMMTINNDNMSWNEKLMNMFTKSEVKVPFKPASSNESWEREVQELTNGEKWMVSKYESKNLIGPLNVGAGVSLSNQTDIRWRSFVFINFGSCTNHDEKLTLYESCKLIVDLGKNVVMYDNDSKSNIVPKILSIQKYCGSKLHIVDNFNMSAYKGKCFMMITHGGHGTILEGVWNKIYTVVQPKIFDQFHWADILESLNLGGKIEDINSENEMVNHLSRAKIHQQHIKIMSAKLEIDNTNLFKNEVFKAKLSNRISKTIYDQLALVTNYKLEHNSHTVEIPVGMYRLTGVTYHVLYNPTIATGCVKSCLFHELDPNTVVEINRSNNLQILNLLKDGVAESELITGLLNIGLNFILIDGDEAIVYNLTERETICLINSNSGICRHCQVGTLTAYTGKISLFSTPPTAEPENETIYHIINNRVLQHGWLALIHAPIMVKQQSKNWQKNLAYRQRSCQLQSLASRTESNIMVSKLYRYQNVYIGRCSVSNKELSLWYVTSQMGWLLVNMEIVDNYCLIYSDIPIPSNVIILNLHISYPKTVNYKTTINTNCSWRALNKATVKYCMIKKPEIKADQTVSIRDINYNLIIADYDNRSHHNYDEENYIKAATKLKIYCQPQIQIEELFNTHDKCINRATIIQGIKYYVTECRDRVTVEILQKWLSSSTQQNCILTTSPISGIELDIINNNYDVHGKQLRRRYEWNKPLPTQTDLQSLIDFVDNSEFRDDGLVSQLITILGGCSKVLLRRPDQKCTPAKSVDKLITMDQHTYYWVSAELVVELPKLGGEEKEDREGWKLNAREGEKLTNDDKWGVTQKQQGNTVQSNFKEAMAINDLVIHEPNEPEIPNENMIDALEEPLNIYIAPYTTNYVASKIEPLVDFPDPINMQLWDDTDLTDWLTLYAPQNPCVIKSRELPGKIIEQEKHCMTNYPLKSRAVLTKVCFEEGRSIVGRMKSVAHIRTVIPKLEQMVYDMLDVYGKPGWQQLIAKFRSNPVVINPECVKAWVEQSKGSTGIERELNELLAGELLTKPMSDVNVHLKVESLLKDLPIKLYKEQQARIIVWQRKAVCAIYTEFFVEIKRRLKELLDLIILYTDGLRPDEISARVRQISDVFGFFENDLTKQDRQTDEPIIDVEMAIYSLLGGSPTALSSWRENHAQWRFKSEHYTGMGESMRLTGQATTAIGNCITNLQVHCNFVKKNKYFLRLALFLGDDMCMLFSRKPDTSNLRKDIATNFNMQSKENWTMNGATFCSMVVYKTSKTTAELGPDVVRMKFRYEVTNGAHECTANNLMMRQCSYLMMLGKTPEVTKIISDYNLPIRPIPWYNYELMLRGVADKWDMNTSQVEGYYHNLLDMIIKNKLYVKKFRFFSNRQ
jgi:hypothetical protein